MLVMVNTNMTHVFKHPKFYRIPRDKTDQAISDTSSTGASERAPGPGHKHQAQAASHKLKPEPKLRAQAARNKPQAPSSKAQASSHKRQAP